MFELLYKIFKAIFGRKDDPEAKNKKKEERPEKAKKSHNDKNSKKIKQDEDRPAKKRKKNKNNDTDEERPKDDKKKKKKRKNKKEDDDPDSVYFPLSKEGRKQKKQRKKEEKKRRMAALGPILAVVILVMLSINVIPSTFTSMLGDTIVVTATMSKSKITSGNYSIAYDFEQDLDNLYEDTKPGDLIKLSDLLWDQDIKTNTKVRVTYIDEKTNSFITSLPRELRNFELVYSKYKKLYAPKRVKLTMKVSNFYQKITDVEYIK